MALHLNHPNLQLLQAAPQQSLILLEDVDAAFVSREDSHQVKTAYEGLNRVTLSGFLNCLDGVASSEARILFMTTNYRERLDPALIRPGRIDVQALISYCSHEQIMTLFQNFYPETVETEGQNFVNRLCELGIDTSLSPASLQGHFLLYKNSPAEATEHADDIHGRVKKRATVAPIMVS